MLKLYTWNTPNGQKIPILLEELGLEYEMVGINITKGEQMTPEFLAINPNNKIPAIVDDSAEGGLVTMFESGAILMYLAEKAGKFLPTDMKDKYEVIEWLMFQVGGVGPMFGQFTHFTRFAPEKIEYAINRYTDEAKRLLKVLNTRLESREYLAGDYSIADIATWPWVKTMTGKEQIAITDYPNVLRWLAVIDERPAVQKGMEKTKALTPAT